MDESRRNLLRACLVGAGALGLRSLATGLPAALLARPLTAGAQAEPRGRVLILNTSFLGEPVNANAPGMYEPALSGVAHPPAASMAPTTLRLGPTSYVGAKPWADLPQAVLDRTAFLHHGTYTGVHANQPEVMRLMGSTERDEMMASIFAKHTASVLGSVRPEPISLGAAPSELFAFAGRMLSNVAPTSIAKVLGGGSGPLAELQAVRDRDLDRLHALYKQHGTENHRRMLDRFAQSRREARAISDALLSRLEAIADNDAPNQVLAAPVLAAMNVSPVISVHIPFGGDNHADDGLEEEAAGTVSGVGLLGTLVQSLEALRAEGALRSGFVVATQGVFGRSLALTNKGTSGRDHNSRHHVTVLMGESIRPGIVGGCEPFGRDYSATAIDPASGRGVGQDAARGASGLIPYEETLESVGKTIGAALGVPRELLEQQIRGGKVLETALA